MNVLRSPIDCCSSGRQTLPNGEDGWAPDWSR